MVKRKKEVGTVKQRLKCSVKGCRKQAKYQDPNILGDIFCPKHIPNKKIKMQLVKGLENQSTLEDIFI